MKADGDSLYLPGAIFIIDGGRLSGSVEILSFSLRSASWVIFFIG
jgi:hypothetical protein